MPESPRDAFWIVLVGIASSLGAVAILTGLGGLLIAARLESAGLPTEIAVAAIPKPVLLTLGVEVALPLVLTTALVGGVVVSVHGLSEKMEQDRPGWLLALPSLVVVTLMTAVGVIV